ALEDMFDLQDRVAGSVASTIEPKLLDAEADRARRKPTENLNATDYLRLGIAKARLLTNDTNSEALQLFCKAVELDPGLASAYGWAAICYARRKVQGWTTERVKEGAEGTRLARKAVQLGGDNAVALCLGGYVLASLAREFDDAAAFMDRGLTVNPN